MMSVYKMDEHRHFNVRQFKMAYTNGLLVISLFFVVANAQYHIPNFGPNRTSLVHLFEWKWADIELECERFLGPNGFGGVQVSPPNENAIILEPFRPWWERYQPVSYKLETRSGTEEEFKSMVRRCNQAGVRIIVDAVTNHMTHFSTVGLGTGGSSFDSETKIYSAVPYSPNDFHGLSDCPTPSGQIEDHLDPIQSRSCEMGGLRDLKQSRPNVRDSIVEFLNRLIGYGVAGFRIDSAKQQWPEDLRVMWSRLDDCSIEHGFQPGTRPFVFQEIIILGEEPMHGSDYFQTGRATEFKFGLYLGETLNKIRPLKDLINFGEPSGMYPSDYSLVFVDNHDNQRGHGNGGTNIITHREPRLYKIANAFMLAWPYGVTKVMSSYLWDGEDANSWVGPPNTNGHTDSVIINPDTTCGGGWICEHRWRQIKHMVEFRNIVDGTSVTNFWDNGNNQIAFCRGNKGFIAINNEGSDLNTSLQTCLPAGRYCDVITGDIENGICSGRILEVEADGRATIFISGGDEESVIATHINARI